MTAPSWVPAGALIHIDFVGGSPQGQAYVAATDSVVALDTLLGTDPITLTAYGSASKYDPTYLMAGIGYGHATFTMAAIGALRTAILAGSTFVFTTNMTNPDGSYSFYWGCYSNDSSSTAAIEGELHNANGNAFVYTYLPSGGGALFSQIVDAFAFAPNLLTRVAMTLTSTRAEWAVNGFGPNVDTLTSTMLPPAKPLVAVLFDAHDEMALDSITVYPTESDASNLAAMSAMSAIVVPSDSVANMDGVASMDVVAVARRFYKVTMSEKLISRGQVSPLTHYNPVLLHNITVREASKIVYSFRLALQSAINLAGAVSYRMKFVKVLRDTAITITSSVAPHSQFNYALTAPISVRPALTPKWRTALSLVQNLLVNQTTNQKFIWGRILKDVFKVSTSLDASTQYRLSLAQLFKFTEVENFKLSHPIVLNQNINLSLSLVGRISLKLLQKFIVATTPSPAFHYHFILTSRVIAQDILEHLVKGILAELFTVHPALDRHFTANSSLAQLLTVNPALNTKLVLKIVGNIQLSPEQLVSMIYRGDPLLDGVVIDAIYISPSGTTTTWVVNTRTNAVTEYLNYDFRSFAQMGDRYIAAGAEGLYELDGDTDDGALIISRLMSGYLQLNEKKLFGIKGAYVAIRGGGRFYLKLISGDGREYIYELRAQPNLMTTKVKVGKGIRTTYMAFELVTEGQDFDLDSVEFIPMTSGRRV